MDAKKTMSAGLRILIADDQPGIGDALQLLFKGEGYATLTVRSPEAVLEAVREPDLGVALIDLNYARDTTSGQEGLDLLRQIQSIDPGLPVVVMTAWGSVDLAVEAMRRGARDFVQKPWDDARLLSIVRTQLELRQARRKGDRLEAEIELLRDGRLPELIGKSSAMRQVLDLIQKVGPSEANLLITGEHGTGKGLVARWCHAVSPRKERPMITVNTGGFTEALFESELFGHVKGAFTDAKSDRLGRFELADGGTLFLDEIANISLAHQAKLLRVIESGEFERVGSSRTRRADVRLISATNADLKASVEAGRFREDLLFRLNTVAIPLPPLRDRAEDVPLLAAHFLGRHAQRYGKTVSGFAEPALRRLQSYRWPGNVRELDHVVERAVLMSAGGFIDSKDLGLEQERPAAASLEEMSLEQVERLLIRKALERHGGNARQAADALGLSRSAFYRRLQKYGL